MTHHYYDNQSQSGDPDERVEQLTTEIDETRVEMTETIEAIGVKLEPANLAHEATNAVGSTTRGKVEQMTYGAQETWREVSSGNAGGILDTIKSNPVPAGMVGIGIAMLLMNKGKQAQGSGQQSYDYGSSLPGNHGYSRQGASWEPEQWDRRHGDHNPLDRARSGMAGAGDTVSQAADQAGQRVSEFADSVGQTAGELPQQAGWYVQQGGSQVRRFIDENPLGAGVIAMAAGAALGMLLPSTQVERQTIGQVRDQVVDEAESTAHEALDKVEERAQG